MELLVYIVSLSYNHRNGYAFTTYGETFFLTLQNIIVVALILYYNGPRTLLPFYLIAVAGVIYYVQVELPIDLLIYAFQLVLLLVSPMFLGVSFISLFNYLRGSTFAMVVSRMPQIITNFKNGNTGQLSAATVFAFSAGSSARIYTTLNEVKDFNVLVGFLLGTAMNLLLAIQMAYYWNAKPTNAAVGATTPTTSAAPASASASASAAAAGTGASARKSNKEK